MKKRVMFLVESMILGGAERVLVDFVNNLDSERFDVTVISIFKESVYEGYRCVLSDSFAPHVKYKSLVDNTSVFKYKLFNFFFNRLPKSLFHRLLIGSNYDVEVAWYEGMPTVFLAHSSNKHSKKLAWLHYGDGFKNLSEMERRMFHELYSKYDVVVGVSESVSEHFRERVGRDLNVVTRYNVVEDELIRDRAKAFPVEYEEITERKSCVYFVSVGRLTSVKGYDRLLRVVKSLKEDGYKFHLWIVGDGTLRSELQAYVDDNDLSCVATLLGNKDNPFPYVKYADWFVCSSHAEGFSVAMVESLILGTPIVSTIYPSSVEMLEDGRCGVLVDNSEDGLYQGLKNILEGNGSEYKDLAYNRGRQFNKMSLLRRMENLLYEE